MERLISEGVGMTAPLSNQSAPVLTGQGEHPEELPVLYRDFTTGLAIK